jgi:glycosyltransferase involved in cell wall biosynthesis
MRASIAIRNRTDLKRLSGLRVCFVIQHIGALGGTERACAAVLNGLAESHACESLDLVELFSQGPCPFPLSPDVRVSALFDRKVTLIGNWPRIVSRLCRMLRKARIDTLVAVESTHALYAVAAARLLGIRVIVWEHFNFNATMGKRKRALGRRVAARFADDIVTLTHRDIALWQAGAHPRARLTCIPNSGPAPTAEPYDPARRLVLAAGRLAPQKGFDRLIAAWAIVERDPRSHGWRLDILGDGPDGAALQAQARDLTRATIRPAMAAIDVAFAEAGLFAASSRFEGLPMVLLEAAAHGVPAVAFDCETGPAEIIVDHETGLLVPEGDVEALADALLRLMDDAATRRRLSDGARVRARAFERSRIVEEWLALLRRPH